jgi:hypothetical protein
MRLARYAVIAGGVAVAVRIARSRHRRLLHPDGRSFAGTVESFGAGDRLGSVLLDQPAR